MGKQTVADSEQRGGGCILSLCLIYLFSVGHEFVISKSYRTDKQTEIRLPARSRVPPCEVKQAQGPETLLRPQVQARS